MRLRESRWLEVEEEKASCRPWPSRGQGWRIGEGQELDLEKELSKVNQEHGGEPPLVLNEESKIGDVKRRQEA